MTLLLRGDSSIHIPYISRAQWAIGCDDFQAYMDIVEEFLELGKEVTCLAWNTLIYDMCFLLSQYLFLLSQYLFLLSHNNDQWDVTLAIQHSFLPSQGQCHHINWDVQGPEPKNPSQTLTETWTPFIGRGIVSTTDKVSKWAVCFLRKNLRDLCGSCGSSTEHYGRKFWAWLEKQPWRRMLPKPKELLGFSLSNIPS